MPEHIAALIEPDDEVEVVLRPVKRVASSIGEDLNEVISNIKKRMDAKYPNISRSINEKVKRIVGRSSDIKGNYEKYSDKEIVVMAMMEKYLEKGEIIESLF